MKLVKLTSITKKMALAAAGLFLLVFLLLHASINLCIIRDDGGLWYRNACHFMGTNYIVKVFEVILLAIVAVHIILAVIVTIENYMARPVRYAVSSKTKTHTGSKWMIWTGGLIACFLVLHCMNFYAVKIGLVEGKYTAKIDKVDAFFQQKAMKMQNGELNQKETEEMTAQLQAINSIPENKVDVKNKELVNLTKEEVFKYCGTDFEDYEPDFYTMANELFKKPIYTLIYLLVFVVLGYHLFHAINSLCQTLGCNHKKYNGAIETCALGYAVIVPLLFAVVPIYVMFIK
ncbi:MAG: succinate dehydrogenase cytochrome b subunit [Bacteroidales bacterium]|jgi:succinate dehydrogenase / fumarate reductase cytochrome b subunit|nr:succinate dehydrogenase cytochrome b subunit [Bacteroidales bacterium]